MSLPTLSDDRGQHLRHHPAAPLLTDCTQSRVELSHATFDNWVCKTVNFLQMECDLQPGATVGLRLPLHWMAGVWLVSVWESGADVTFEPGGADLTVGVHPGVDVYVVADPLGMGAPPADATAEWFFPADVRGMPDQLVMAAPAPGGMPGLSAAALREAAVDYAARVGLTPGGRLLTGLPLGDLDAALAAIGSPLAVGAGVVYGSHAPQEAPTATAG